MALQNAATLQPIRRRLGSPGLALYKPDGRKLLGDRGTEHQAPINHNRGKSAPRSAYVEHSDQGSDLSTSDVRSWRISLRLLAAYDKLEIRRMRVAHIT